MSDKKYRNGNSVILCEDNETVNDEVKVANIFNEYFSTIASSIGFSDALCDTESAIRKHAAHPSVVAIKNKHNNAENFHFTLVSDKEIEDKLKTIKPRKATGYDNIPGKLLKLGCKELCAPFANLINNCIQNNVFPDIMKCAEVSPIYKKADNLSKCNYRPVSVLTSISKLYESVLNDQLYTFLAYLFEIFLSAFRKGYSCQSLLIKFIEDMKQSIDQGKNVGVVFMDLSKAFDCLPHGLLIAKLNAYGLSLSACETMASYLTGRTQRVKISHARSDWKPLTKGVPQGSILGPLLFNVFMNDMFYFIERCDLYNYADDNSIAKSAHTLPELLADITHDCNISLKWFHDNGMQANPDKFQFMVASSKKHGDICININDTKITSEPNVKALGVIIDCELNFSAHISYLCKKAARQLNALARISRYLDPSSKMILYNSFVKSNFNYCPIAWHFCGKVNNGKLEKIQERALRIINKDYSSAYDDLLSQSGTDTLLVSRLKKILFEVFKTLKDKNPEYLKSLFVRKYTPYAMRNKVLLIQPKRKTTTYGIRSVSYTGAKLWNDFECKYEKFDDMSPRDFNILLEDWCGPNPNSSYPYV